MKTFRKYILGSLIICLVGVFVYVNSPIAQMAESLQMSTADYDLPSYKNFAALSKLNKPTYMVIRKSNIAKMTLDDAKLKSELTPDELTQYEKVKSDYEVKKLETYDNYKEAINNYKDAIKEGDADSIAKAQRTIDKLNNKTIAQQKMIDEASKESEWGKYAKTTASDDLEKDIKDEVSGAKETKDAVSQQILKDAADGDPYALQVVKDEIAKKAEEFAKTKEQGNKFLNNFFGTKPTNDGCAVVTPGQTPEYGNMWGEVGVAKDPGGKDAFGNEALKGMESPTNKQLREKHLGYRDDDAIEIAKKASADPTVQDELSRKKERSNADWAGWKGETPLPGEQEAIEHMNTPGGGYKTKGGMKMRPTGKDLGVGAYVKGNVVNTADGKKAKVTADCSFVEATQEDWKNLQKSAADAAKKIEPPVAVPPPASSSSLFKPLTNIMSNLTPFPFNMFESLAGNIGIQTWQLFGGV